MSDFPVVKRAADWLGLHLDSGQEDRLRLLAEWLVQEAIPAGGLGPSEGPVVHSRHLADSLLFASAWPHPHPPRTVLDIGSGVGLPGIPLAIAWPSARVTLVERSSRRSDLARRAIRILGLENVDTAAVQLREWNTPAEFLASRAMETPERLLPHLRRLLLPGGVGVVGGSRRTRPRSQGYKVEEIPRNVIDKAVWLLIITGK